MDGNEARRRFAEARVARLATVRREGGPHVVPIVFALEGDAVWFVVDEKPKRSRRLRRLVNLEADPRASMLVDHYEEDWERLWWVRADGRARISGSAIDLQRAVDLLAAKYPPYRERRPPGPAVAIEVERWAWWSSGGGGTLSP